MKRWLTILGSHIRCEAYLFGWVVSGPAWRGERKMIGWGKDGKVSLICTITGSLFDNTAKVCKVFYNPKGLKV